MSRKAEIEESDRVWREEKESFGWSLPPKANFFLRLPVVRHVRWLYHSVRAEVNFQRWRSMGIGLIMNPYDRWLLWAIYRGWC